MICFKCFMITRSNFQYPHGPPSLCSHPLWQLLDLVLCLCHNCLRHPTLSELTRSRLQETSWELDKRQLQPDNRKEFMKKFAENNYGKCYSTVPLSYCQALSISQSLNLSLSLRDRDRADTIITLYHTTPHHHRKLF